MNRWLFLGIVVWLWTVSWAQEAEYEKNIFVSSAGDTLPYRLLRPQSADESKFPLVIFLHGAGERGTDNEKQLTHGGEMFRNPVNRDRYPAYVLFPQCPPDAYWAYPSRPKSLEPSDMPLEDALTPQLAALMELIGRFLDSGQIDNRRVYLVGLSMGAMGVYDLAVRFPEVFAAAVPICGTVNPDRLQAAVRIPFRIFHGDADPIVPVEGSRAAYRALKKNGAQVDYVEYPGVDHISWNVAFAEKDFMSWLFACRKP